MKLGWDLWTGLERRLSSWRSSDDPSPGDLTWGIKLQNNPETIIWRGLQQYFRSGPWTGIAFTGAPELFQNPVFKLNFVSSEDEVYLSYDLKNISAFSRIVVHQTTNYREGYTWKEATQTWVLYASVPRDSAKCLQNSSCIAYSNSDVREGGSGCIIWYGDLIDIRQFPAGGQELYIRTNPSESEAKAEPTVEIAVIVSIVIAMVSGLLVFCYCICKRKEKCRGKVTGTFL
ncbi:hypothetical protein NC653_012503 [Populus alba x Populus x berolinensis]|uniref:S-locus glycoprotein domain-containing protein n=1 Tax=Populus alba x Populus x berolinensis TaxID=444605 RepID=A0AAD6W1H2_9ROSI|nr:hypothetical protein NC653_012503 [Populus alba x Populus x berolinensis]